jgi:hypothetical protein
MSGASEQQCRTTLLRSRPMRRRLASLGEVHLGLGDGVEVVREDIQSNMSHDLGDFGIAVPRLSNLRHFFVDDVSLILNQLLGEVQRRGDLGIRGVGRASGFKLRGRVVCGRASRAR